jgi:hypothetical protein
MEPLEQNGCDPDVELMLRVKHGDEGAFDELARKYREQLASFFYTMWRKVLDGSTTASEAYRILQMR